LYINQQDKVLDKKDIPEANKIEDFEEKCMKK